MVSITLMMIAALGAGEAQASVEGLLAEGKYAQAHHRAFNLERKAALTAPLAVMDGQLLREPAVALGVYKKARNQRVSGKEIFLYAQVRNHHSRKTRQGFELHLVSDLLVLDKKGNELASDQAFGESRYVASVEHRDTFVNIALKSGGLPSGEYVFRLVVNDRIGNKKGHVDIPVVMP